LWCLNRTFKNIVLENAFFDSTVWKLHPSNSVLDSFYPFTFVTRAIDPIHLTIPMPLIILVAALIDIATLPDKLPHSILLIVFITTLISVAVLSIELLSPFTLAVFQPTFELAIVDASILPFILAHPIRFALGVSACENIAVCEDV
jgi:hypothetical protein